MNRRWHPVTGDVEAWTARENETTEDVLGHLAPLRAELERLRRSRPPITGPRFELGGRSYLTGWTGGTWHLDRWSGSGPRHRIAEIATGPEEPFLEIGALEPSDDGRYLALTADRLGDERYALTLRDLERGRTVAELANVVEVAWSGDGTSLFATRRSDAPYRAFVLCRIETSTGTIEEVWREEDPYVRLALRRSDEGRVIFLDRLRNHSSKTPAAAETWWIDAGRPTEPPRIVAQEVDGRWYQTEQLGDDLLLRTNDVGPYFRIVRVPLRGGAEASVEEVIPHRDGLPIADLRTMRDRLLLLTRPGGIGRVDVHDPTGTHRWSVAPDEAAYELSIGQVRPGGRPALAFDAERVVVSWSSFVIPPTVDAFDTDTGDHLDRLRPSSGLEARDYAVTRIEAPARDGVAIPAYVLRRNDAGGPAPVLLQGYGAYGFSKDPGFDRDLVDLVDRGATFVLVHVRGGGELGVPWHDAARRRTKAVSAHDLVDTAEHLVSAGIADSDRIVIQGASAGGTLVAIAMNERPEMFSGVVALAPLADLMACQSDPLMPFSVNERQEWGDPLSDVGDRATLESLCPTLNATSSAGPPVYATAGILDGQVRFWEPAAWVEALRAARGHDAEPVLLRVSLEGGHHGPSEPIAAIRERSLVDAFILERLGLVASQGPR